MKLIYCQEHGKTPYCLICKHLREQSQLGYFEIPAEPLEPAQAWCEACDIVLEEERGWSDRANQQADWKLFCTGCYRRCLALHRLVSWVEGTSPEED